MSKGLEDIEIIRESLIKYKNKADGTNIKCLISPQFAQVRKELKAIEVLQDGFSFASYNPNGDYFVIYFTIKENCDRNLINETLFGGSEVLKCQKE